MDEFPSGSAAPEPAAMSLEDRLRSKVWKDRLSGYEEIGKLFATTASESDPVFATYIRRPDLLRGMALDANAAAQEKGVEALCAFVRYGGRPAGKTREEVMPAVSEKCLGSMRTGTRKAAYELILLYAEKEDVLGCEGLVVRKHNLPRTRCALHLRPRRPKRSRRTSLG